MLRATIDALEQMAKSLSETADKLEQAPSLDPTQARLHLSATNRALSLAFGHMGMICEMIDLVRQGEPIPRRE